MQVTMPEFYFFRITILDQKNTLKYTQAFNPADHTGFCSPDLSEASPTLTTRLVMYS